MSVFKKITHMAVAAAAALGASTAFAASYPVLGTEGSVLEVNDLKYTSSIGTETHFTFHYAGGTNPVTFSLIDIIDTKGTSDVDGYFRLMTQVQTGTVSYGGKILPTYSWQLVDAFGTLGKALIEEGSSVQATLTTSGLYRLSFLPNSGVDCFNLTTNIADLKISTVPLPGTAMLFASSLIGAGLWRRRVSDKNR
jgi:hypothetical protein